MKTLLLPDRATSPGRSAYGIAALLMLSATALFAAPLVMPPDYSWISNAISESGAQGLRNAWVVRLGFLTFGLAVLWLAAATRTMWARSARWLHAVFGASMVATAAFAHRPWIAGVPFDPFEDWLHSLTATVMGFAFSFGVLARLLQRGREGESGRAFDVLAIAAAVVIPLVMLRLPEMDGLIQRMMFAVSYLWYGRETLLLGRRRKEAANKRGESGSIDGPG